MDTSPSTYFSPFPSRTLPRSTRTMTDSGQLRSSISLLGNHADFFTFAKHVSFEHSTGIPCPVNSSRTSRRDGNINKRTKLKSFLPLDRRSVSPHRPACVRALRGQWAIWLAPRLSLATESTGTVLIPSQMSEIAGHGNKIPLKEVFIVNKIPLKEVFISNKKPFSVGSDSTCVKLPWNKVYCFTYSAKWNEYLLSIL